MTGWFFSPWTTKEVQHVAHDETRRKFMDKSPWVRVQATLMGSVGGVVPRGWGMKAEIEGVP